MDPSLFGRNLRINRYVERARYLSGRDLHDDDLLDDGANRTALGSVLLNGTSAQIALFVGP